MKLTLVGKVVALMLVIGIGIGTWKFIQKGASKGGSSTGSRNASGSNGTGSTSGSGSSSADDGEGLLGRPLRVGVVTWPGYAGGIVANNGFKPNTDCIYWNNHKLKVEFLLMEDVDARAKAFARGGADGVDIVWSTTDFWANELPGFRKGGIDAKTIMQVDWSRGGDAIVVDNSINRIEDLKNKKISLALFTPSQWLLEYSISNSSLDETEQSKIVKGLVGKAASPDAAKDFIAGKVDAAVVWEPDVTDCLKKRPNSHILVDTSTATNLIADLMIARTDFIKEHPDVVKAFVQGWFEGTAQANRNPGQATQVLMDNEPLYKELGEQATRDQLSKVRWADLSDNTKTFGLDGSPPLFDRIFRQASEAWVKRGYITAPVSAASAKDDSFLRQIYAAVPKEARVAVPKQEFKFPVKVPAKKRTEAPILTKRVNIYFASDSAALDANARAALDNVALLAQTYSNAYMRVEGNTSGGNPAKVGPFSQRRAQAVVNYLANRYGLSPSRFIAVGNGSSKPIAPNTTEANKAKNRRTDIVVVRR